MIKDDKFPWDPIEAIYRGFQKAENCFLDSCRKNIQNGHVERSGSCCIVVLIVGNIKNFNFIHLKFIKVKFVM